MSYLLHASIETALTAGFENLQTVLPTAIPDDEIKVIQE